MMDFGGVELLSPKRFRNILSRHARVRCATGSQAGIGQFAAEILEIPRAGDATRLTRNYNLNKSETLFLVSLRLASTGSG
jgi:hypothetical protein